MRPLLDTRRRLLYGVLVQIISEYQLDYDGENDRECAVPARGGRSVLVHE
jgi:hypothetical protein